MELSQRFNEHLIPQGARVTTILSGGMDSTTLLYYAMSRTDKEKITVLSFNYGQRHKKELLFAESLCKDLGINFNLIDFSVAQTMLKSALTGSSDVPHGHYAEDNMKATVVPNRNAIMLSFAYGVALSRDADFLLYGAHSGDHYIYPDCRQEFVEAIDNAFRIGNKGFGDTQVIAPFGNISKSEIVTVGLQLNVPYERTWSCYEGGERPCLKCGTCVERTEAFMDNNIKDPLLTDEEWERAVAFHAEAKARFEGKE